jgi:putative phage-type endonuclease
MRINDLELLKDILDSIVPDIEPSIFEKETDSLDFIESVLQLMNIYIEENPTAVSEPDFEEIFDEEIRDLIMIQFEDQILFNEDTEDEIHEMIDKAFEIYYSTFGNERSNTKNPNSLEEDEDDDEDLEEINEDFENKKKERIQELQNKINNIRAKPQPPQRTPEWYQFRYNLITASNAYKAFESQANINQLIYEKCQPLKVFDTTTNEKPAMTNVNTTLHWGQKYEPLSVLIYEKMNNTKVSDFGCLQHDTYKYLGASPDGINTDTSSDRFGRMLEIKNIVNREITGIPKKEYWIQTQLQMEVCDLDECDFLETRFVEFENETAFYEDTTDKKKGIIMYFHSPDGKPHYIYKLLDVIDKEHIVKWEEETMETNEKTRIWIKTIYWKLDEMSCVLIQRNKTWFQTNIGQIENVWRIIEQERITGYEHRAPKKREKKEVTANQPNIMDAFNHKNSNKSGCLINIVKLNNF